MPSQNNKSLIYFTGNSLGLQVKKTPKYFKDELDDWAKMGVEGHFKAKTPWVSYHTNFDYMASVVGAKKTEVVLMNTLTANLHFLFVSFFNPTKKKTKILVEKKPFPSDYFVVESQLKFRGLEPKKNIIESKAKDPLCGSTTQDILEAIHKHHKELALVFLGGVNYYSGYVFDMQKIAKACREYNIPFGLDLAHAAGNVSLKLHKWEVDFAAWCSYKYLNAGPGGVGGVFIHKKHHKNTTLNKFTGWWGHTLKSRFEMKQRFDPIPTAESWQLSNAPIMNMVGLKASLEVFKKVGIKNITKQNKELSTYLYQALDKLVKEKNIPLKILTPRSSKNRGAQLSLYFKKQGKVLFDYLEKNGIVADWRHPGVIRVAPVALYNTKTEIDSFVKLIEVFFNHKSKR